MDPSETIMLKTIKKVQASKANKWFKDRTKTTPSPMPMKPMHDRKTSH